ncbi:MAG: hypothetical protein IKZ88_05615 [Neisseriaceae bacterium]|nr:hypothetical protein [Neisseriaceae bacterium]
MAISLKNNCHCERAKRAWQSPNYGEWNAEYNFRQPEKGISKKWTPKSFIKKPIIYLKTAS